MNCAPEGQHYQAARNLQAERLGTSENANKTPRLIDRILVDLHFVASAVVRFLRSFSFKRKTDYKHTSSLRFY